MNADSRFKDLIPLLLVVPLLHQPGCAPGDNCERICDWETACYGVCDFVEDPECDPEETAQDYREACLDACHGGTVDGRDCGGAEQWVDCLDRMACGEQPTTACEVAEMRYHEVCLGIPGDRVCDYFCTEIENGCTAWEEFGYRGHDCVATCAGAAQDPDCREAHYAYDACSPGTRFACQLENDSCDAEVAGLIDACDAWSPGTPIPAENVACDVIAAHQCACGLRQPDEDCVAVSANRCRFHLGLGPACVDALNAFDLCMIAIQDCDRDKLRELCLPEWDAWYAECVIGQTVQES